MTERWKSEGVVDHSFLEGLRVKSSAYDVLGVARNATRAEIKNAQRKLIGEWHSDTNAHPDASEVMRLIIDAYRLIDTPEKRNAYDRTLGSPLLAAVEPPLRQDVPSPEALKAMDEARRFLKASGKILSEYQENKNGGDVTDEELREQFLLLAGRVRTLLPNESLESFDKSAEKTLRKILRSGRERRNIARAKAEIEKLTEDRVVAMMTDEEATIENTHAFLCQEYEYNYLRFISNEEDQERCRSLFLKKLNTEFYFYLRAHQPQSAWERLKTSTRNIIQSLRGSRE